MPVKIFSGLVALALLLAYLLPVLFKLKEVALGVVVTIGVAMALIDLLQSLGSNDE